MARPRTTAFAHFVGGCLAVVTAGIYAAYIAGNGTNIGHWRYLTMALFDIGVIGTPVVLAAAAVHCWVQAARASRRAPITRRALGIAGLTAAMAIAMAIGRPRNEAVALFAWHALRTAT